MSDKEYYHLSADSIFDDVLVKERGRIAKVADIDMIVEPHVYPSDKFRSTNLCLSSIKDVVPGKIVCDMGCGPGTVGIFALKNGAKKVVQVDINPYAVKNALENKVYHNFSDDEITIYESDCFDKVPRQVFDIIVFPMPYHNDEIEINDPLQRAFYDPGFRSIRKFLSQLPDYSHKKTEVFISFSNKGDVDQLESIFESSGYNWELWKITNQDAAYDNRFYKIKVF